MPKVYNSEKSMDNRKWDNDFEKKIKFIPIIRAAELSESYYEHELFHTNEEVKVAAKLEIDFEMSVEGEIIKVDPAYLEIWKNDASTREKASETFRREIIALNVELFGLAWFSHNYRLLQEEKLEASQLNSLVLTEIWFIKHYLERGGNADIWEAAKSYNDTIMQATIAQKTELDWSIPRDFPGYYERGVRPSAEKWTRESWEELRKDFGQQLDDEDCCTRLANRGISCDAWQDGIMLPQKLSSAFFHRISFTPNFEALLLIQRVVVGLYNNAALLIKDAEKHGSYEVARKTRLELRVELMKKVRDSMKSEESDEPNCDKGG